MRMRTTTEPNEDELVQLMKNDPIGRNRELGYLVRLLDANPEGLSIFLNGTWGSGKSYFVRQAELLLRALNPNLGDVDDLTTEDVSKVVGPERTTTAGGRWYLPVYFNAWRHDAFGEPVLSLMCDIADMEGIRPERDWDRESFKGLLAGIAKCLMKATLPAGVPDLTGDAADMLRAVLSLPRPADDPLEEYRSRKKLDEHVDGLVRQALRAAGSDERPADAIVMFVDELDRCRPSYAMEVLESVKHLLVRPDVVVVFSVDARQLAETIRGAYGMGYDADRYLRRFYDVALLLPEVDMASFAEGALGQSKPTTGFDLVARELTGGGELVMRDAVQLYEMLSHAKAMRCKGADALDVAVNEALCPLVCYLQVTRQADLESAVLRGEVGDGIFGCVDGSRTLRRILDNVIAEATSHPGWPGTWTIPDPNDAYDNIRKDLLRDLLLIYLTKEGVRAREDALGRLTDEANLDKRRNVLRGVLERWAAQG